MHFDHGDAATDARGLVGRGRELEQLDVALSDAIAGRGGLVVVTGEPGIGKTALARAFVEHAAERGASWAWGTCWDGGGAPAYWPWVQIARALARREDAAALRAGLGDGAAWIAGLLPELGSTLGPAAEPSALNADQARFRLFDALASLLGTVAQSQPLVVVLDDLHWSDVSTVLALEFVARSLPDQPVLTIAAYRQGEAHARDELAAALGALAPSATRLRLHGLSREDVGRLVSARAQGLSDGDADIPPPLLAAVHHASAGNPFFVDELVQLLASQGRLYDAAAAAHPLPLPDGVRDTIRRRLAPLDEASVRTLGAAAVIGREFRLQTLARVAGDDPAQILERLDGALRAGLVRASDEPNGFAFVHALVRDALLSELGADERGRLHLRAADALERLYGDDLEPHLAEVAHHRLQGASVGGAERAVDFAARAGARAIGQFAYEEAARLYSRAIDVAASLAPDELRAWTLHQGLGEALMRAGDADGSIRTLRQAIEHARHIEDPGHFAQTAMAGTLPGFSSGGVERERVAWLEEALARMDGCDAGDRVRRAGDDAMRCRLRVQLALALYWTPQSERRERLVEEAHELARAIFAGEAAQRLPAQRALADRTLAFALAQGFQAVWGPDTVERGLPISVEALELCERTNDAELAMQVRLWRIGLLLELDDPIRAEAEIEAYGETARRLAQPRTLVYDSLQRAMTAHMRGEFARAQRLAAEAVDRASRVRSSMAPLITDAQTFLLRRVEGRHHDLEPLLRRNADGLPALRRWRASLALVLAEIGRTDEARRELDGLACNDFGDLPRDATWLVTIALLAELCTLLADRSRARRLYELLAPYEGRNVVSIGAAYLGPVARYLGLLAMTIGQDERALEHLETARSAAQRIGARPAAVLIALDAAEVLARRGAPGDAQRAVALVATVAGEAERLAMDGAITRVAELRARLAPAHASGASEVSPPPPVLARLARQSDIWLLDYGGRSVCLQDAKGLQHLASLLASPGRPIDAAALAAGRARGRQAAAAAGDGSQRERARVNVTRALRAALRRIAEHEPELGRLLDGTIRTGTWCAYEPAPDTPLRWEICA